MREIVLDTETTGMDPATGDRLVEIGCVEMENHLPTGRHYHVYINPERDVPAAAVAVHGLTSAFLKDKPTFGEIVGDFTDFIGDSMLVIHNAEFDVKFLNAELKMFGFGPLDGKRVLDTVAMARKKFPGSPANLDALCRRFNIDNSNRTLHGALLDAQLLAEVYLELLGGRQRGLDMGLSAAPGGGELTAMKKTSRVYREPRVFKPAEDEIAAHAAMMKEISKK
jgi:DNA polymerase-3 subunit epsilon